MSNLPPISTSRFKLETILPGSTGGNYEVTSVRRAGHKYTVKFDAQFLARDGKQYQITSELYLLHLEWAEHERYPHGSKIHQETLPYHGLLFLVARENPAQDSKRALMIHIHAKRKDIPTIPSLVCLKDLPWGNQETMSLIRMIGQILSRELYEGLEVDEDVSQEIKPPLEVSLLGT